MENCTPSGSIITARRSRRHKEVPQWTVRDDYCIWWIGEQRAVRYDHVQRLSAHESDQQTLIPGRLSATRTTQIIHRWQKANLVIYIKVHAKSPGWIYLTLHGLRFAQLDYRYSTPRESTLTHLYYIIQVPLQMEEEYDEYEMEWQSERYLREEQKRLREDYPTTHIPYGIVVFADGKKLDIKVGLLRKTPQRLIFIRVAMRAFEKRRMPCATMSHMRPGARLRRHNAQ